MIVGPAAERPDQLYFQGAKANFLISVLPSGHQNMALELTTLAAAGVEALKGLVTILVDVTHGGRKNGSARLRLGEQPSRDHLPAPLLGII